MSIVKIIFKISKENIFCTINITNKLDENQLLIDCQTNFNNNLYSLILNYENKKSFLDCSSSNEAIDLLTKYFYRKKIYIKEINNSEIDLRIPKEKLIKNNELDDKFNINDINMNDYDNINNLNSVYIFKIKNSINPNPNLDLITYQPHIKKKEYIFWRDGNFDKLFLKSEYYHEFKLQCSEKLNMKLYCRCSIEKSLKFILINKYDKVILITNVGLDLSGKRYIEIARKILGFDVIVLFFSSNPNHLKWIQKFPNCLYAEKPEILKEYIENYNIEGLKKLKEKVEKIYKISLKNFSDDFILYPNYEKEINYSSIEKINEYIRHVYIYCENQNLYLCMDKDGKIYSSEKGCEWDVTILYKTITLFSHGHYLDLTNDKENTKGLPYMRIWNFEIINENFYFINPKKNENNILSIENGEIRVNKNIAGKNEIFKLIDISDSCNDIPDTSFFSQSSNNLIVVNNIIDKNSSLSGLIFDKCNSLDFSERSLNKDIEE